MSTDISPPTPLDDKLEAVRQWSADPCGSHAAGEAEPGTKDFFDRVDADRYLRAQPWMDEAIDFSRFTGRRVLEVGHGMGGDLMRFARRGAIVSGLDLTPRHHELATERFAVAGVPVDLRIGDGERMPFPNESFDVVYSFGVVHHTPDQASMVREMRRVLAPGGELIVGVYHRWSLSLVELLTQEARHGRLFRQSWRRTLSKIEMRENSDACPLVRLHSRRTLRRLLSDFENVTIDSRGLWTRSLPALGPRLTRALEYRLGWFLIATARKPTPPRVSA